ncbi:MAG: hypothetical protein M3387_07830, partial [Actinomycetota bacterium]|nr:hypothetical protein [Actinomycetota bacterium]
PELRAFFERTLLDQPWADPELPSLVGVQEGEVVAFLGSHVRRLSLNGRPGRLACSGQLVVDPGARNRAMGAFLLKRYMSGAQDVTITDGATDTVRAIWERLGGETAYLRGIEWVRVLRPWGTVRAAVARRRIPHGAGRPGSSITGQLDRMTLPAARLALEIASSGRGARRGRMGVRGSAGSRPQPVATEPLSPRDLVDHVGALAEGLHLHVPYDETFADWLLNEVGRVEERGRLVARTVRDRRGVAGWFVYFLQPGGLSPVLQIGASDEPSAGTVLDALIDDAREGGAAAVHGRVEPLLLGPLRSRRTLLRNTGGALVHARDPAVHAAAVSRHALLTRLEGEWWMGPHLTELTREHGPGPTPR